MPRLELGDRGAGEDVDRGLGDPRIAFGRLDRVGMGDDQLDPEREAALVDPPPHPVEHQLIILAFALGAGEVVDQLLDRRRRLEGGGVDQPVEQLRPPAELLGQRRRVAEDGAEMLGEAGPGLEQAVEIDPARAAA